MIPNIETVIQDIHAAHRILLEERQYVPSNSFLLEQYDALTSYVDALVGLASVIKEHATRHEYVNLKYLAGDGSKQIAEDIRMTEAEVLLYLDDYIPPPPKPDPVFYDDNNQPI